MLLKSIHAQNFRKFDNITLNFASGLNIVYGPNESGKSTLLDSILTLFFVDPTTSSRVFFDRNMTWRSPWKPVISSNIGIGDIDFELTKDFNTKQVNLTRLSDNKNINHAETITKQIRSWLGLASDKIYTSTAVIRYAELSKVESEKELQNAIQTISSGGNTNSQRVLETIDTEIKELTLGLNRLAVNPGEIKKLMLQIEDKSRRLQEMKTKRDNYISSLQSKDDSELKLENLKKQIKEIDDLMEYQTKIESADKDLYQVESELSKVQSDLTDIDRLKVQLDSLSSTANIDIDQFQSIEPIFMKLSKDIEVSKGNVLSLTKKLEKQEELLTELESQDMKKRKFIIFGGLGLTFFSAILGILNLLVWGHKEIGFVLTAVSVLWAILTFITSRKGFSNQNQELIKAKLITQDLKDEKNKLTNLDLQLQNLLHSLDLNTVTEYFERRTKIEIQKAERYQVLNSINSRKKTYEIEGNDNIEKILKEKLNELLLRKSDIELNRVGKYKQYRLSSDECQAKKDELSKLLDEQDLLQEEKIRSKTRLDDNDIDIDQIIPLEESLDLDQRNLASMREKVEILKLVQENLALAISNTSKPASTMLKLELEKYLPIVTQDRYSKVNVTDNFNIELFVKDAGGYISFADKLSAGTIDQIYFIARVAFLKLLCGDSKPPLILDDVFANFDDTRLGLAFNVISELSREFQIFYLTCHRDVITRFGDIANLIDLSNNI